MDIVLEKHSSVSAYLARFNYIGKIDRGMSGDGKHRIRQDGRDFLLRIAKGEKNEPIKREFDYLKTLSEAGLPVPACVDLPSLTVNSLRYSFPLTMNTPGSYGKRLSHS